MPVRKKDRFLAAFLAALAISISTSSFAQPAKEIRITANEFSFKPAKLQVPQGEVKIVVTNRGKFPHSLAIVGREEKIPYIESGETQSMTIRFDKEEEIVFYCSQPGHRRKGMEGKLIVQKK